MRILVITPTFYPVMGGAEKGIYEIFSRLAEKHEVKILTPFPRKNFLINFGREDSYEIESIEVLNFHDRLNLLNLPGYWRLKGIIPPFSLSTIFAASKTVNLFRPDVAICFYPVRTGLAALFIEKFKRVPTILTISGRDVPGPGVPSFWRKYYLFILRRIGRVIFESEFCRKSLGLDASFGQIVPFGIDTKRFKTGIDGTSLRKRFGFPENSKVLLSIQRLDKWKRVDILIKAMRIVLENIDAYLVIGGKGSEMESLVGLSKELSVDSRVIFTGYIKEEELPLFYAMADLFVFHSTYETLGLVLIEAMASGKPIVSVRSTAIPEVVEDGVNGILVEPLNPSELAEAIIFLLKNPEKMKEMGKASREIALRKFSLEEVARRYEMVLLSAKEEIKTRND
jgi:glycosyltransferase involved in cell wall biosynthesis